MPRNFRWAVRLVLVLVALCHVGVYPARGQGAPFSRLPDSLPSVSALSARLSDAGAYFDTDNLISNERGYQQVLNAMDRLGVRGGAYIGVGPEQNFTYIARTRPKIAFLVDIRRDNLLQHLMFKALFARSRNRAEFLTLWTGRPVPSNVLAMSTRSINAIVAWLDSTVATTASAGSARAMVRDEAQRSGIVLSTADVNTITRFHDAFIADGLSLRFTSTGRAPQPYYPTLRQLVLEHDAAGVQRGYLASEDDFQFVKSLQRRNLVVPVTGDLSGTKTLPGIARYLAEVGEKVSVLYASNVEDYLIRDGTFATYVAGVRALPRAGNAVMIRSFFGGGGHPESTGEYYATQLLQRMDAFANDASLERIGRYRDLVLRNYLPLRAPLYEPGERVLLDGHNAYPEKGLWVDRIERVLATGTPVAIEQDLYWRKPIGASTFTSVVAHDSDATDGAPTLEQYFFARIAPIMERTLRENHRESWPLITLNLDFKTDEPAHHDFIYALLGKYSAWLTTAPRTATPEVAAPLSVGPLLVLAGSDVGQRASFHDAVPVGGRLRAFGAIPSAPIAGATREERARRAVELTPAQLIEPRVSNYARWVNFPWSVVEEGGQRSAGTWTSADSTRLVSLVARAHEQSLWIRFYTLDGFTAEQDRGFTASYNFGGIDAAKIRWRAVIDAGVDFVATDQYGEFAQERTTRRLTTPPTHDKRR